MSAGLLIGAALLGGVGSVARFVVSEQVAHAAGRGIAVGTTVVNLSAALLLGLLVGAGLDDDGLELLGTGLLGGYSTFSAWMLETLRQEEDGDRRAAVIHVVVSLLVGLALAWAGRELGQAL